MLIIEGSDMVGKTTFASAVARRVNEKIQVAIDHGVLPQSQPAVSRQKFGLLPKDFDYVRGYLDRMTSWCVCDRMHLSEMVYGSVVRNKSRIGQKEANAIWHGLKLVGGVTVVIAAHPDEYANIVQKHYLERPQAFSPKQCMDVNGDFFEFFKDSNLNRWVDVRHLITDQSDWPAEDGALLELVAQKYFERQVNAACDGFKV